MKSGSAAQDLVDQEEEGEEGTFLILLQWYQRLGRRAQRMPETFCCCITFRRHCHCACLQTLPLEPYTISLRELSRPSPRTGPGTSAGGCCIRH
jgi:hypothetical protein